MKSQMSSFDIAATVRELQACIGLRAEKFFMLGHDDLFFRLAGPDAKRSVTVKLGRGAWVEDGSRTTTDSTPPTFAMLLRKHLGGAALADVSQHGFDRIIVFGFEGGARLIAELFGSGNVILVRDGVIIQPLTSKSWKARDVKAGREYLFPPESQDPFSLNPEKLAAILRSSKKDLVRCLATEVNLGGAYAEDACCSLGRQRSDAPSSLEAGEVAGLLDIISGFRESLDSPSPHILFAEGSAVDVLPFELAMHDSMERKPYPSFGQAAKEYFANLPDDAKEPEADPRRAQLERQLEAQSKAIVELDRESAEMQAIGDALYANYPALEGILSNVGRLLASGNWQAAKPSIEAMPMVKAFHPSDGMLSVVLPDGAEARLDVRLDLNGNAAAIYDRSKKARQKAEGAREALGETRKALEQARVREEARSDPGAKRPTKRFWFDTYRWFVSSEGFTVVGGRDTRTNDQVVKRHLKDGDIYVHADANGAPSIVVKDGARAGEATLEEACIFAVAFSRSWKAKVASGSAYWVTPDQVSKTPNPGEYVPKGAFIIRGKRNYSKKLEMRLAIAMVKVQGADKVMCGPEAAVRALSEKPILIEPGDEKRSDLARRLSEEYNVPIEEIDRALPPGDVRVLGV